MIQIRDRIVQDLECDHDINLNDYITNMNDIAYSLSNSCFLCEGQPHPSA